MLRELVLLGISAAFINNFMLTQFFGIAPALGASANVKNAVGMGLAVLFVLIFSSLLTWVINAYVLVLLGIEFMETVAFMLVIVAFVEWLLRRKVKILDEVFGKYMPIIIANCAILGIVIINSSRFGVLRENFAHTVVNSVAAGLGFLIVIVLLAGIRERLELKNIPRHFRGIPIALISAALIAIAFLGFSVG